MSDTIFALSSGSPPAAIAVVRISGPRAAEALRRLAGQVPEPRRATVATLKHPLTGQALDRALLLYFEGPATATGEDIAELHLHGGRAVVAGVLAALADIDGLRPATPGEFTRRAFENGRIDLTEAEGLADLLTAETESQRRAAMALAEGALSRRVAEWQRRILDLGAALEAAADFSDEDNVADDNDPEWIGATRQIATEMADALSVPPMERLKDGTRVVISGPPNAGKSTLFNALVGREAAITSPLAGTTRDAVEAPTAIGGNPFVLVDTAGLRDDPEAIEAIGIERTRRNLKSADIVLWLGEAEDAPGTLGTILVQPKSDLGLHGRPADVRLSARTGEGMAQLLNLLVERSREMLPRESELALNARHRECIAECLESLAEVQEGVDELIAAEALRQARMALDRVTGRAGVEDLLDSLFGRFCIGK